jgi:hypothetical protein
LIFLYGPDGGIFFSNWLYVGSIIDTIEWEDNYGNKFDSIKSDSATWMYDTGLTCGGDLRVRIYTEFGGSRINLLEESTYYVQPGTTIYGRNNGGFNFDWGPKSYSVNVNNEGYYLPNPQTCFGNGTVTDSWTYNSQ